MGLEIIQVRASGNRTFIIAQNIVDLFLARPHMLQIIVQRRPLIRDRGGPEGPQEDGRCFMSKVAVCNMQGDALGEYAFPEDMLVLDKGAQAVQEAVVAYRANQRAGTASTRGKGEIAGAGSKPWRQKGSGRARAGYRQSPLWRGGGTVFGPRPRSFRKGLNKKTARLAFCRAFSDRVAGGCVTVIDELAVEFADRITQANALLANSGTS